MKVSVIVKVKVKVKVIECTPTAQWYSDRIYRGIGAISRTL